MESVRERLLQLEKEDAYLFHGSGAVVKKFEPRQAFNYTDGVRVPDGSPAIFASPSLDCAMFRAIISDANFPHGAYSAWSWSGSDVITFKANKKTLAVLRDDMQGYVYVFNREGFTKKNMSDWVSYEPVQPISVFTVTRLDFKPLIEEMQED